MAGYLGTKAVLLSTTAADVIGNAEIGGDLTVDGTATITDTGNVVGSNAPLLIKSNNGFATTSYGWDNLTSNYDYAFKTNGSERMRIDSSGNVGIGTSSPAATLDVNGSAYIRAGSILGLYNTDNTNQYQIYNGGSSGASIGQLVFTQGGVAERMRINSSGNVRINNTDAGNYRLKIAFAGDGEEGIGLQTTFAGTSNMIRFLNSSAVTVGYIQSTVSSTNYVTSSDYRLKTDAQPMTGASARVQALKPVNFEWIASGERVDGFLAHEAQEVVPEAVTGTKDAMRDEEYEVTPAVYEDVVIPAVLDEEGNELEAERTEQRLVSEAVMGTRSVPDYQGIDQSKLVPLLTAALQEALTEIADLKARVTALEAV